MVIDTVRSLAELGRDFEPTPKVFPLSDFESL